MDNRPIGVFDSGLGGLTVVKSIIEDLPQENIVYFGDTGRVPYGSRSKDTLLHYVRQDIEFLLKYDVKAIVIACNTADAMARVEMEAMFKVPIFGVVAPAGKKAAETTRSGKIGVIATSAAVASRAYEKVITGYAPQTQVFSHACPLLVPLVENGRVHKGDVVIETVLREYLEPLRNENIDTLILGCTHYPLLTDIIADILPGVSLISSGSASAEALGRTLAAENMLNESGEDGGISFYVSDDPEKFARNGGAFIGREISGSVGKIAL